MHCRVCRGNLFDTDDNGNRVCRLCGTQSRDFFEQVVEATEQDILSGNFGRARYKVQKEICSMTYEEGLQQILIFQVNTLIEEFHFTPLLLNAVAKIWFRYLKDPNTNIFRSDIKVDLEKQEDETNENSKPLIRILNLKRERATMNITLAILYLGCMCVREPVIIADIIRWVRSGKIPFLSAYKILPPNIKELFFFRPLYVPNCSTINKTCKLLVEQLDLGSMIAPLNIQPIIRTWIKELLLPEDVVLYIDKLVQRYDANFSISANPSCHSMLMGYVVFTLKLIYGFFDIKTKTELIENIKYKTIEEWIDHKINNLIEARIENPWKVSELMHLPRSSLKKFINFCKEHPLFQLQKFNSTQDYKELSEIFNLNISDYQRNTDDIKVDKEVMVSFPGNHYLKAAPRYVVYMESNLGEFHKSYSFLLSICSSLIEVEPSELHRAVTIIEQNIFHSDI